MNDYDDITKTKMECGNDKAFTIIFYLHPYDAIKWQGRYCKIEFFDIVSILSMCVSLRTLLDLLNAFFLWCENRSRDGICCLTLEMIVRTAFLIYGRDSYDFIQLIYLAIFTVNGA